MPGSVEEAAEDSKTAKLLNQRPCRLNRDGTYFNNDASAPAIEIRQKWKRMPVRFRPTNGVVRYRRVQSAVKYVDGRRHGMHPTGTGADWSVRRQGQNWAYRPKPPPDIFPA